MRVSSHICEQHENMTQGNSCSDVCRPIFQQTELPGSQTTASYNRCSREKGSLPLHPPLARETAPPVQSRKVVPTSCTQPRDGPQTLKKEASQLPAQVSSRYLGGRASQTLPHLLADGRVPATDTPHRGEAVGFEGIWGTQIRAKSQPGTRPGLF